MFCRKCGSENSNNAYKCTNCDEVLQTASVNFEVVDIPNYLVQSIIVTVICCMPLGIPAIVFASMVNSKIASGDLQGAQDASDKAKIFCILALVLGFFCSGGYVLLNIVVGFAEISQSSY